ncbi:MAG: MMPL family transporter [Planctomycetaceae bacterium]|nr:MMPL family transporter [Planctomycetaceae bacterium]
MTTDDKQQPSGNLHSDFLQSLTRMTVRSPRISLSIMILLACVSVGITLAWMGFKTERADLIDPSAPFQKRWKQYAETFGDTSEIIVVVEADDPQTIKNTLDDLGGRIEKETDHFRNVLYKIEPGELRTKGLQYLSPVQLEKGLDQVEKYLPIIRGRWDRLRLDEMMRRLSNQIQTTVRNDGNPEQLFAHAEQLGSSLSRFIRDGNDFSNPWPDIVPIDPRMRESAQEVIYLMNDSGNMGFLKLYVIQTEKDFSGATTGINRLREILGKAKADHPDASFGMTGIPILENDEMRESQSDMWLASVISVVGVGLVLLLGFRGYRHPALAMIMLAIAMAWAFGYTTLAVGHLNILSVSFAAILIGLGIDFAIHYLARYLQLRHEDEMLRPALLETSGSVGVGIVTAAVTTALAFFCASFTQFLGVAELGIIAGGGILLCALATFLVLPALIALADQNVEPQKLPTPFQGNALKAMISRAPKSVLATSAFVILGTAVFMLRFEDGTLRPAIKYDSNLLNLQAEGLNSVELQKRIFQGAQHSLLYAVSVAESPEETRELKRKFEALPTVHHVEELGSRIPSFESEQTKLLVQAFHAQLEGLPERPPEIAAPQPMVFGQRTDQLLSVLKTQTDPAAVEAYRQMDDFLDRFSELNGDSQQQFLRAYQYRFQASLLGQFQALYAASNSTPVRLDDLPSELTSRFVSPEGKWLLQIYPRNQIWDVEPLEEFVESVRSIDPNATGTPLQNYEASRQIKESYQQAAIYALAVIAIVLLLDFLDNRFKVIGIIPPVVGVGILAIVLHQKSIDISPIWYVLTALVMIVGIAGYLDFQNSRDALLALVPPIGGSFIMFGLMGILDIDLNPANLIVLPLVLGIGVDDGVHVIHDFREQRGHYQTSSSTINAIVLTSLTSMIGFGSMMVASHRGLYSVGMVLVIGVGSCLLVSLVTLPALLTALDRFSSGSASSNGKRSRKSDKEVARVA